LNQKKPTIIENLAFLSVKHNVYLGELFEALVSARESGKSSCSNLRIQYRGSVDNEAIFLITEYGKVVVQFRVDEELLLRKNMRFESWMNIDSVRKEMSRQDCGPNVCTMVQDLRHGMKRVNVEAEVLEPPESSPVRTRYGNSAVVTNVWIADETGKVKLCLWNEQAGSFTEGDRIQIKNASVSTFKGERQLRLGKTGTISVLQSRASGTKQLSDLIAKSAV
jgi:Single-stranded DNA binding protein Ssb-like, OB fold